MFSRRKSISVPELFGCTSFLLFKGAVSDPKLKGWLHLAHGVRNTAAGLRYVLYMFMTDLREPSKIIYRPGGYFMAPEDEERIGDVANVLFSNGWIAEDDGTVLIYYAASIRGSMLPFQRSAGCWIM